MGDLTKNLSVSEFICKCKDQNCDGKHFDFLPLAKELQLVVNHFADTLMTRIRIDITSGGRCHKHNIEERERLKKLGVPEAQLPAKASKHMEGIAGDYKLFAMVGDEWVQIPTQKIHEYLCAVFPTSKGLIRYASRNHFDLRKEPYRHVYK